MIDAARLTVDEIARIKRSFIDLQYAVKKVQFFYARMPVSWIIGSGSSRTNMLTLLFFVFLASILT